MRFIVLFLVIASCLYLALAQVSLDDCCLKYVKKMTKGTRRMAVVYRRQEIDGGCNIPAIIFTMKRGRSYCTDPRQQWVQDLMKAIDKKHTSPGRKHGRRGPKRG